MSESFGLAEFGVAVTVLAFIFSIYAWRRPNPPKDAPPKPVLATPVQSQGTPGSRQSDLPPIVSPKSMTERDHRVLLTEVREKISSFEPDTRYLQSEKLSGSSFKLVSELPSGAMGMPTPKYDNMRKLLGLRRHMHPTTAVAWFGDGKLLTAGGYSGARVWGRWGPEKFGGYDLNWDAYIVKMHPHFSRSGRVAEDVAVVSDGIFVTFSQGLSFIYDRYYAEAVHKIPLCYPGVYGVRKASRYSTQLIAQTEPGLVCAFAFDGSRLSEDSVEHHPEAEPQTVHRFQAHNEVIEHMAWHANGRYFATSARDGSIRFWDYLESAELARMSVDANSPPSLSFSPDGRYILAGRRMIDSLSLQTVFEVPHYNQAVWLEGHPQHLLVSRFTGRDAPSRSELYGCDQWTKKQSLEVAWHASTQFSQSDSIIAVADRGRVELFDRVSFASFGTLPDTSAYPSSYTNTKTGEIAHPLCVSVSGKAVAVGYVDGWTRIWMPRTGS